jgi:hypothetical protein
VGAGNRQRAALGDELAVVDAVRMARRRELGRYGMGKSVPYV